MRADVKLGVIVSAGIVLVAGGYYVWRSPNDAPIEVTSRSPETVPPNVVKNDANKAVAKSPSASDRPTQPGRANQPADRSPNPDRTARRGPQPAGSRQDGTTPGRQDRHQPTERRTNAPSQPRIANQTPLSRPSDDESPSSRRNLIPGLAQQTPSSGIADQPLNNTTPVVASNVPVSAELPKSQTRSDLSADPSSGNEIASDRLANVAPSVTTPIQDRSRPESMFNGRTLAAAPPTANPQQPTTTNAAVESHIIQPGDSFAALARKYYGSERLTDFLVKSNPEIGDPSRLRVGATLKIPPRPEESGANEYQATGTPAPGEAGLSTRDSASRPAIPAGRTYVVKEGDSFYSIARSQLGNAGRWNELFEMNKALVNGDPTSLRIGQVISLPKE